MTFKPLTALVLSAAMAIPATGHAFTAENRVKVQPRGGSTFEVREDPRWGVPGQWCAAADYAVRALGADWNNRIYVQGNRSRNVVFGLSPKGATPKDVTNVAASARQPGANFTVQRAFSYCIQQRQSIFN